MDGLKTKEEAEKLALKLEWFGAISKFTANREGEGAGAVTDAEMRAIVNSGFYHAEGILDLRKWEEEGIDSILAKDFEEKPIRDGILNSIKNYLSAENDWETIPTDIKILLDGGDIFTMDVDAMEEAIEKINLAYDNLELGNLRLKEKFEK